MRYLLIFSILIISTFATADDSLSVKNSTSINIDSTHIVYLKAQLETMNSYNDRLISTVYWSLSIVAGLAILLAGFGWFANFKFYEKEKHAIKQELENNIQENYYKLQDSFKEIEERIEKKFKEYVKNTSEELNNISQEPIEDLKKKLEYELSRVKREINNINLKLIENEASDWMIKKIYPNAARSYASALDTAIGLGNQYEMSRLIDNLIDAVEKSNEKFKRRLDASDTKFILEVVNKIPSDYHLSVEKIKKLLE